jgi:hypothetical protein
MNRHIRVTLVVVLMLGAGILLPRLVSTRGGPREVQIVVRDMTYYVDGSSEPNPALVLTPGEDVRVSLRNDDKGMVHDFSIPAWGVGTKIVEWQKQESVTFRVPASASSGTYACTPHSVMMSGRILLK